MKINLVKITMLGLVAAALTFTPTISRAQNATTNAPSATPKKGLPLSGKVTAVDTAAETLTIGKKTFSITSATKITNTTNSAPATLSDITVGETVSVYYKKDAEGKMNAQTIHIGVKAMKHKSKKAAGSDSSSTNSVSN